jgi:hypothetical protein
VQIRIVLSWSANPSDLDIHMVTPTGMTQSQSQSLSGARGACAVRVHCTFLQHSRLCAGCKVWYANRKCQDGGQDLSLDFDVQTGYGPETISVNRAIAGQYRFYVNKYAGSGSIEESEAKVQERHVMLTVDHRVDSIDSALLSLWAHMPDSRTRQRTAAAQKVRSTSTVAHFGQVLRSAGHAQEVGRAADHPHVQSSGRGQLLDHNSNLMDRHSLNCFSGGLVERTPPPPPAPDRIGTAVRVDT